MKRPANPSIPALGISPNSACPLYRQVYDQLRQAILQQKLPAGTHLPSTRALARRLGVSRNTVLNAYEALIADALIVARKGSGTRVGTPSDMIRPLGPPIRPPFDVWAALRKALFPTASAWFRDADGNFVYVHR